jgi:hypothetical protein
MTTIKPKTIKHKSAIPKPLGMPKAPLNLLMSVIKPLGIDVKAEIKKDKPLITDADLRKRAKVLKYKIYHERIGDVWNWNLAVPQSERINDMNIGLKTHGQWINDKTRPRDPKFMEIKAKIDQERAIHRKKMEEYKLTTEYKEYSAKKKIERDGWKATKTPQLTPPVTQAPPQYSGPPQQYGQPQQQYNQYTPPMQQQQQQPPVQNNVVTPTYTPPTQQGPPTNGQWGSF